MIFNVINEISTILNDRIKNDFKLERDIVKIQSFEDKATDGSINISLINIERDTSGGISFGRKQVSDRYSSKGNPAWNLNIYIIVSAVFPQKQYAESLKLMTKVLKTLQEHPTVSPNQNGTHFTVEPVNLSFQELSNLWSISGGAYHPSVVCKIRTVFIDDGTIVQIDPNIKQREVDV